MSIIEEREKALKDELNDFDDWKERYAFIIDLGDELEDFPEALRVEANKVQGCVSQVWVFPKFENSKLKFLADSDSLFVKGLVAVMLSIFNGLAPQEILDSDSNFLLDSGLVQNLSPNRANGAVAMVQKIKDYAKHYADS